MTTARATERRGISTRLRTAMALCATGAMLSACVAAAIPVSVAASAGLAAAQEGVSVYSRGKVKAARFHTVEQMHAATLRAFQDLGFEIRRSRLGPTSSFTQAEDATGVRTTVSITERSERVCSAKIRVGLIGDRFLALLVLERIDVWLSRFGAPEGETDPSGGDAG